MEKLRCTRCGKMTDHIHFIDGLPVCADDRLCYPSKNIPRKIKKLAELRSKFASFD